MELIKLNQENLKVILSKDDMIKFNISTSELDYSNVKTKQIIWTILSQAKTDEDFNTDSSKIYVEIYASRDGGCEMFIKKIGFINEINNEKNGIQKFRIIDTSNFKDVFIIIFELEELLEFCRRMSDIKYSVTSSLYLSPSGKYILRLKNDESNYSHKQNFLPNFIFEYGKLIKTNKQTDAYINEHCRIIILNQAINKLAVI